MRGKKVQNDVEVIVPPRAAELRVVDVGVCDVQHPRVGAGRGDEPRRLVDVAGGEVGEVDRLLDHVAAARLRAWSPKLVPTSDSKPQSAPDQYRHDVEYDTRGFRGFVGGG